MTEPRRCRGATAEGAPCRAPASVVSDDGWCFYHDPDPETAAKRREAQERGRQTQRTIPPPDGADAIPEGTDSLEDALAWQWWAIKQAALGKLDSRAARDISYGLAGVRQLYATLRLDARVKALEAKLREIGKERA